eukprot:5147986-Alexandrium_andersonii.AAC.1
MCIRDSFIKRRLGLEKHRALAQAASADAPVSMDVGVLEPGVGAAGRRLRGAPGRLRGPPAVHAPGQGKGGKPSGTPGGP